MFESTLTCGEHLQGKDAVRGHGLAEELAAAAVWLSLNVEGDMVASDGLDPLTDWRIVVAPPLVLQNQLPVRGTCLLWEEPKVCALSLQLCRYVAQALAPFYEPDCMLSEGLCRWFVNESGSVQIAGTSSI